MPGIHVSLREAMIREPQRVRQQTPLHERRYNFATIYMQFIVASDELFARLAWQGRGKEPGQERPSVKRLLF